MRIFIATLLLIFSFQSLTKADDISDFEIEGMSVGDSAINFFSEDEILNRKKKGFVYKKKDFYSATFRNKTFFKIYDQVQLHLKKNDQNYIIYSIGGKKIYYEGIKKCYEDMEKALSEMKQFFPSAKVLDEGITDWSSSQNVNTKVKSFYVQMQSKDEVSIACYDHPESGNFKDNLTIAIDSKEFVMWLHY